MALVRNSIEKDRANLQYKLVQLRSKLIPQQQQEEISVFHDSGDEMESYQEKKEEDDESKVANALQARALQMMAKDESTV